MTLDTDTQSKAGTPLRTRRPLLIALGCLLILFLACGIILLCALRPVTAEAGGGVLSADAFRRIPALPLRCVSDLTHASYEAIGTHEERFTCLGIPLKTTLTVADTTPPRAAVHDLAVLNADSVRPPISKFWRVRLPLISRRCSVILPAVKSPPDRRSPRVR